ncbi:zinc-binding oxidoreductase [Aspergillus sclerotiicarbonarius CBS 121057]|uniref:Zinc-binding oxidoreductase n=1 Tax=Aspergillus sclerotiicarbonarius (strain CBS 121057 / IBT 28362) TaxID=1448318 RepID=A0A319E0I0_ASPSB|nr:zinc-binding oxidoreductase [Aspergillus sclerotiicarbonarius CBS 121057]
MASPQPSITIPHFMRAWTLTHRGLPRDILQLSSHYPVPQVDSETAVLIRISHVALHPGTIIMMTLAPSLLRRFPSIAETDFSGTVVAVGAQVPVSATSHPGRYFSPGTAVFGSVPVSKHLQGCGALAEYVVVDVTQIARKPVNMSFAAAAGLPVSGATALALLDALPAPPDARARVLVNGACGGIGHFVTQLLATRENPATIMGTCSESSAEVARTCGCHEVLDYRNLTGREKLAFDAIIDAFGSQALWRDAARWLKPGQGHVYVSVGPALEAYTVAGAVAALVRQVLNRFMPVWMGGVDREYKQVLSVVDAGKLERLRQLAEEGRLETWIGGTWAFENAMQAFEILLGRHAKGKLVVRVQDLAPGED